MKFKKILKRAGSIGIALLLLICVSPFQTFAQEEEQNTSSSKGVSVAFEIALELNGDEPETVEPFTFVIEPSEETVDPCPLPESTEATITGEGTVCFDEITFTQPGEYVYEIRQEVDTPLENSTYDDNVYVMRVKVVPEDSYSSYRESSGILEATISGNLEGEDEKTGIILFSNSYIEPTPTPTPTVTPVATPTTKPSATTTPGTSGSSGTSGTTSPKTGDNSNVSLWALLLFAAAVGMSGSVWRWNRTRKHSGS
jgi:pilin isopeptide linkage protein